jgi:hypothetical protein
MTDAYAKFPSVCYSDPMQEMIARFAGEKGRTQ